MDKKDMKKFFIIQYVIIGLLVVLCLFLIFDRKENNASDTTNNGSSAADYDVSKMNEVNADDILDMFDDDEAYLLYIGRETCGVCKAVLPNLIEAQEDLGYTTQYLDITKVDRSSDEWDEVEKLLDVKTSLNVMNENGEKELVTKTYGYFIGTYGYTPTLIIINNGKMIDGHIGNYELKDLKEWLQINGIG